MNSSACTSDPPASGSSRSRQASTWTRRTPLPIRSSTYHSRCAVVRGCSAAIGTTIGPDLRLRVGTISELDRPDRHARRRDLPARRCLRHEARRQRDRRQPGRRSARSAGRAVRARRSLHWSWRGGLAVLLVVWPSSPSRCAACTGPPDRRWKRASCSSSPIWCGRARSRTSTSSTSTAPAPSTSWPSGTSCSATRSKPSGRSGCCSTSASSSGSTRLTRAWGRVSAVGAAWITALLILTPIGLSALAWHGAVALALWAVVFAVRATQTHRTRHWAIAGVLAGLALDVPPRHRARRRSWHCSSPSGRRVAWRGSRW